jgi:hypothetical protein
VEPGARGEELDINHGKLFELRSRGDGIAYCS